MKREEKKRWGASLVEAGLIDGKLADQPESEQDSMKGTAEQRLDEFGDIAESEGRYCVGVCTCGNDCHGSDGYHLTFTTWNGAYPSLYAPTNPEAYAQAVARLGVQ